MDSLPFRPQLARNLMRFNHPEQLKIYDQLYAGYVKDADGRAYNIINYMREMGNPLAVRDVSNNTLNTANNFNANLNLEATLLRDLNSVPM